MNVMVDSNDGFVISQRDLELRGPGDIVGNKQSGVPEFKVGDPIRDMTMLNIAQQEAIQIVSNNDWQKRPENKNLAIFIEKKVFQKRF